MKVILLQRVKGLGEPGATVEVAAGHARNFLIPRGLAQEATRENMARLDAAKQREAREAARLRKQAEAEGQRLQSQVVHVQANAGESGRLFGSVTAQDVVDAIERQFGIRVDRKKLELPEPLKTLGDHPVLVRLHAEVNARVTVRVESA